ncbi:MAG: Gfo/Idh/MocA family protein [Bryobacteraceae bacterium]
MATVRIGVIGAGWWAVENHIPALKSFDDVEVSAICRLGRDELRRFQDHFQIPFGTEDYRELLSLPGLDGVIVCSPHHLHYEHAKAALERGLHVVCEKPMTLDAGEARELRDLAETQARHFLIPYGWSYSEMAEQALRSVRAGLIGEIQHVHCHMASALRELFSGQESWVGAESLVRPELGTWANPAHGGGWAHGQLTHALGLLFLLSGLEPESVFGITGLSSTGADLFNAIACRFRNGATGTIGGAATMPVGSAYQVDVRLYGTKGMLLVDVERPRMEVRCHDGAVVRAEVTHPPGGYSCVAPLRRFVDLIQGKPVENLSSARVGAATVALIDAALRSARSGVAEPAV